MDHGPLQRAYCITYWIESTACNCCYIDYQLLHGTLGNPQAAGGLEDLEDDMAAPAAKRAKAAAGTPRKSPAAAMSDAAAEPSTQRKPRPSPAAAAGKSAQRSESAAQGSMAPSAATSMEVVSSAAAASGEPATSVSAGPGQSNAESSKTNAFSKMKDAASKPSAFKKKESKPLGTKDASKVRFDNIYTPL